MIALWLYVIAAAILCGLAILVASYFPLWLQAYFTGTRISLLDLVLMSSRKSNPRAIVQCKVMAVQSGLAVLSTSAIEAQYLASGDIHRVTRALIAANRAGICLDWNTAVAIDLAGRDVMEAVRVSVHPKVIPEWDEYDSRLPKALQQKHVLWMCAEIEEHAEVGPTNKLHRWIGFVQGAMLANRMLDLDELQAMFDEAKRAHGEAGDDLEDLLDHLDPTNSFELDIGGQG